MSKDQVEIDIINISQLVQSIDNKASSSPNHIEASAWESMSDSDYSGERTPSQAHITGPAFEAISWIDIDGYFGTYYNKKFFNKSWNTQLRKLLESIRDGRQLEDIESEFVIKSLYEDYITSQIKSINCGKLLIPERGIYSYLMSDILSCRDQIIHSEVTRLIGLNILKFKTSSGNQTVLDVMKKTIKKTDFWKSLPEITSNANAKPPSSLENCIMEAWDIVTLFHEVGRLEESYKNTLSYIQDYIFYRDPNTTGTRSENFLFQLALERETERLDHGKKNSTLIEVLIKAVSMANEEKKKDAKSCIVPYYLAKNSLSAETRYLKGITDSDYNTERKVIELWQSDPLSCLFVTVLILSGLTTRICWNSKSGKKIEDGADFETEDIGIYMPVEGLRLDRNPSSKSKLIYKVVEEYAPVVRDVLDQLPTLDEPRINFLRVALGPKCLKLLSKEELEVGWDWVNLENIKEEKEMKPNTEIFNFNVFICHSSKDKEVVQAIINEFKKEDITYWVDHEQIKIGDRITEKIAEGLKKSKYTLVLLSKNLGKSNWCRAEYGPILNKEYNRNSEKKVIPLKIEDCGDDDIPLLLYDKRIADYSKQEEFEELVDYLKG